MSSLGQWVGDVFSIILSISFLEIMLPEGSIQKYVRFIFGIVVMAVIIEPISSFIHN